MCDVQAKGSTGRELDQMPPLGRVRDFPLALLWRISANRERATGRERGLGSQSQRLAAKGKTPTFESGERSKCHVFESSNGNRKSGRRSCVEESAQRTVGGGILNRNG